ncbi:hypothetical protein BDD12DRAFT_554354 [Trichophaea hybrida]|nr:hypothetical protein BDD12DRAFT_554354 [Trichophaea hybrida]
MPLPRGPIPHHKKRIMPRSSTLLSINKKVSVNTPFHKQKNIYHTNYHQHKPPSPPHGKVVPANLIKKKNAMPPPTKQELFSPNKNRVHFFPRMKRTPLPSGPLGSTEKKRKQPNRPAKKRWKKP